MPEPETKFTSPFAHEKIADDDFFEVEINRVDKNWPVKLKFAYDGHSGRPGETWGLNMVRMEPFGDQPGRWIAMLPSLERARQVAEELLAAIDKARG